MSGVKAGWPFHAVDLGREARFLTQCHLVGHWV